MWLHPTSRRLSRVSFVSNYSNWDSPAVIHLNAVLCEVGGLLICTSCNANLTLISMVCAVLSVCRYCFIEIMFVFCCSVWWLPQRWLISFISWTTFECDKTNCRPALSFAHAQALKWHGAHWISYTSQCTDYIYQSKMVALKHLKRSNMFLSFLDHLQGARIVPC